MTAISTESPTLVIDDSQLMRLSIRNFLSEQGYTNIEEASNGLIALEKIKEARERSAPIRLIFLDWAMPGMDGLTFLKKCRADRKMDDTAIIMVTSVSEQGQTINAFEEGATAYITKPFGQENITKTMERVLSWAVRNGTD